MHFAERSFRDALGDLVIQSRLRPAVGRSGFEKRFFSGVQFGLEGWQRAHSQGAGTGRESAEGIRFAPPEVNQAYQNHGIEKFLRKLVVENPTVELWLTTVTSTHPRTLRLREIQYRVDAVHRGASRCLLEASIEVSDDTERPRVTVNARPLPQGR
ncbi:MAG: polymorphic toxin type 4 domain-containing protein [Rubrivivax sp.]